MSDVMIHTSDTRQVTCVPNTFIDLYMKDANGEYVKVYLYLLRCLEDRRMDLSIPSIADSLDLTEKDVRRALGYWENQAILRLEYNDAGQLTGICMLDLHAKRTASPAPKTVVSGNGPEASGNSSRAGTFPSIGDRPQYSAEQISAFEENEAIRELLYVAGTYFGRPLTHKEIDAILYWNDSLKFSPDLIEYLFEYCIDNNHKSIYYMDRVALGWAENHITSVEQAKNASQTHSKIYYAVMKAFGITNRALGDQEQEYLTRWEKEYGFDQDLITEACHRTIANIAKPSFEYADRILRNWHSAGVNTTADVARLDAAHQEAVRRRKDADEAGQRNMKNNNRFHNFAHGDYDITALEDALIEN